MSDDGKTNVYDAHESTEPSLESLQRAQFKRQRTETRMNIATATALLLFIFALGTWIATRPSVSGKGCIQICCSEPAGPWVSTGLESK